MPPDSDENDDGNENPLLPVLWLRQLPDTDTFWKFTKFDKNELETFTAVVADAIKLELMSGRGQMCSDSIQDLL